MARSRMNFEIVAVDAEQTAEVYDDVSKRMRHAAPAFRDIIDVLEEGELNHFRRVFPRYIRTGATLDSLTQSKAAGAIRDIHSDGGGLTFGTNVWYAHFLTKPSKARADGEVPKKRGKGKSAVLVLQPAAKRQAAQVLLDYCLEPASADS